MYVFGVANIELCECLIEPGVQVADLNCEASKLLSVYCELRCALRALLVCALVVIVVIVMHCCSLVVLIIITHHHASSYHQRMKD